MEFLTLKPISTDREFIQKSNIKSACFCTTNIIKYWLLFIIEIVLKPNIITKHTTENQLLQDVQLILTPFMDGKESEDNEIKVV